MSKQTTLEAVKRAMRTAGKANLALTIGKAIEALEDEADAVVAVDVPVTVGKFGRGAPADEKVAAGVAVKPADEIEKGRLATARGAEDRDELILAEGKRDAAKGSHGLGGGVIVFGNALEAEHSILLHYFFTV